MARGMIGLDIGSHSIKLVQLKEGRGSSWRLVKFGIHKLPAEAIVDGTIMNSSAVIEGIRELMTQHKIKAREVATVISGHSVIIKKITLPLMTEEELEESIQWEAEQYIPFSINEVHVDTQITNKNMNDTGQMEVLLVAAKKDVIYEYTTLISEAGLKPLIVDVASFAIENCFDLNEEQAAGEIVALVNVGATLTTINILNQGITAFTRDVNMGGNQFTEEIQKQLNVSYDEAEALKIGGNVSSSQQTTEAVVPQEVSSILKSMCESLAGEIHRSIDFYLGTVPGTSLSRVVLSGGVAKVSGLTEALGAVLNTSVIVLNPFKKIIYDPKEFDSHYLRDFAPMSAVCVGLAIRRLGDKPT